MKKNTGQPQSLHEVFTATLVKDIMRRDVLTLESHDSVSKAGEIFSSYPISHLPVVDHHGHLVGLISHKYLYKTIAPRRFVEGEIQPTTDMVLQGDSYYFKENLDKYILRSIMKKDPFSVGPMVTLAEAVQAMAARRIGCIPVVDADDKVIGLLTDQEVVQYTARLLKA